MKDYQAHIVALFPARLPAPDRFPAARSCSRSRSSGSRSRRSSSVPHSVPPSNLSILSSPSRASSKRDLSLSPSPARSHRSRSQSVSRPLPLVGAHLTCGVACSSFVTDTSFSQKRRQGEDFSDLWEKDGNFLAKLPGVGGSHCYKRFFMVCYN